MNEIKLRSLMVLGAASELYNCSEILRDAIESDDDDQFSAEYIEGERDMVRSAARDLRASIDLLLEELGVDA